MGANRRQAKAETTRASKPTTPSWAWILAAAGIGFWSSARSDAIAAQGPATQPSAHGSATHAPKAPHPGRSARSQVVLPSDDWTFRPTVVVRRGTSQGSGTIIASIDGETLVLTAAHVVQEPGPISIELHRYNLGLERVKPEPGAWPRAFRAEVAAKDPAADLAILSIARLNALPYVARLSPGFEDPASESLVTSIGIDLGTHLSSWTCRLVETLWFELNDNRDERPFFITAKSPEHGRSGGGLFLTNGELVGVCVGHAELVPGKRMGVFASRESIRQLLRDDHLAGIVLRSELRRSNRDQNRLTPARTAKKSKNANANGPTMSNSSVSPTSTIGANRR